MKFEKIEAIFFDAADTLFYIKEGLGNTYANTAKKYDIDPSPSELKNAFSKHFNQAPPLAFDTEDLTLRKQLEKDWWYKVVKNVYAELGMFNKFDEYFDDLFEVFRKDAWTLFPETIEVLSELKNKQYKLIVVSNFDSRVYDVCRSLNIFNYFDDFIISSEAGFAKPEIEIFKLALERNSLDSVNCLHTGDNYLNDYVCPISIGMNALYLDRDSENQDESVNKINNLKELLLLLN